MCVECCVFVEPSTALPHRLTADAIVSECAPRLVLALLRCALESAQPKTLDSLNAALAAAIRTQAGACAVAVPSLFKEPSFVGSQFPMLPELVLSVFGRVSALAGEDDRDVALLADFMEDLIEVVHRRAAPECLSRFTG